MLPGETFQQFSGRVHTAARERLAQLNPKLTKPNARRKSYFESKKMRKKDKEAEQSKVRAAKTALASAGNAAAIKRARTAGLDIEVAEDVIAHTDKIVFGERAEAPPALPSVAFFEKLKKKWAAKSGGGVSAGRKGENEHSSG
jgi:hypothetical protein